MHIVLFDIDGTLLHPHDAGRRAMLTALSEIAGRPIALNGIKFAGLTDVQIVRDILLANRVPSEETEALLPGALTALAPHMQTAVAQGNITVLPGVLPLLTRLVPRQDVALGLVTGNTRATAPIKLAAAGIDPAWFSFGGYGDDAVSRNDLPPLALRRAAAVLGEPVAPQNTLVVGDTPADIACAHVNGLRALAVCTGWTAPETLAAHHPDALFPDLSDLGAVLDVIFGE